MGVPALFKPEYLLRPSQLARRLYRAVSPARVDRLTARLPWGWPIEVDPNEEIGKALLHLGVYDLAVSEILWRLADDSETALDMGANLGYMTALLARRVGSSGRVLSFEALPENVEELQANVGRWRGVVGGGSIQVFALALSDTEGSLRFELPSQFALNRGTGRVVDATGGEVATAPVLSVPCSTLDHCLEGVGDVGVAKLDVEGHEEAVLRGGLQALRGGRIRDWVFEHHSEYPSAVTDLFEGHGYRVFQIKKQFFKPVLLEASKPVARSPWVPQSFVATLDPERALRRMQPSGWQSLM